MKPDAGKQSHPDIELLWPGKNRQAGGRILPFYPLESVDPKHDGWRNYLICGDNRDILYSLAHGPLRETVERAGGIKLIYADPPFSTGEKFFMPAPPENNEKFVAWRDELRDSEFLNMLYERLLLMHDFLAPDGCLYLHCDWRFNACARLMLDEIFGYFINEIIWHYTGGGRAKNYFSRKHDSILVYAKSGKFTFNGDAVRIPYKKGSGYAQSGIVSRTGKRYMPNPAGTVPDDVWDMPIINPLSRERTGYPTQKPVALLERIIRASSTPGDLVADFFCGSGTLAVAAQKLGRKWLVGDREWLAIHTTRKRLLDMAPPPVFDIFSCGEPRSPLRPGRIKVNLHRSGNAVRVELAGYLLENMAANLREHVDYWAVDFFYDSKDNSVFKNDWRSFRKKNKGEIEFVSAWREVQPEMRQIAVKVADIFGNETMGIINIARSADNM